MKFDFSGKRAVFALGLLLFALAVPMNLYGQILYGSLVGNVKDASDAAVAGATVTITNTQTNQTRQTVTNDLGSYNLPTLEPGTYSLRVTKEGFSTHTQSDVLVSINTVTRVDVGLKVGAVTETVTVSGQIATLQTDRSEVRAEITSTTFQNLPVAVGRNYQQLFRMLPGFRPPTNAHSVPTNPSRALTFNVNGVSYSINNTRIDGAASNAPWLPHVSSFVPTLEAIDTVNVVTNSFDAEQGLAGGAAINVQIRSGTNDLHASVFEFHTDNALKAKPFFLPVGQRKPKLVNNEFGGTLGGPIKKDKLFYFMSYEGNLNREFASRFGTVPTAAIRRGDMSESVRPIYDPATGEANGANRIAFPGNIVPLSRQSSIIRKLVDLTPLPNLDLLTNNYFATASYLYDRHRADTKLNWNIHERWSAFSRFSINHYDMDNPQMFGAVGGPEISGAGGNPGVANGNTFSYTAGTTYIFNPNFILDAYVGWTRMDTSVEQGRLDEKLGLDFLGIPGTNGTRRFEGGWPQFNVDSYTSLGVPNAFQPYYRRDPQVSYVANFNWTRGSHEIRFGGELYYTGMNHLQPEATGATFGAQGGFQFGSGPTQTVGGPAGNQFNSYATFLLGLPTTIGKITQVPDEYNTRQSNYAFYIRDRWNATPKLTLSYGVRWEYYPFPTRADRGLEWYDGAINKMLICGVGQIPENCGVSVSKKLFAPRFGIAYRATNSLVMRAGYGITYDPFSLQRPLRTNYPVLLIQNITSPTSFAWAGRIEQGIPRVTIPDVGNGIIDVPGTFAVVTTPKNFDRGYIQSWNFTIEKQLPWNFRGQAGYVATRSTRQLGYLNVNNGQIIGRGNAGRPLQAQFGRTANTTLVTPFGTTQYNSLQASLSRRFSQGLQVEANYTWSKVIGYNVNSDSGPNFVSALPYFEMNRTLLNYDRPHMFHINQIWDLPFGKGKRWATSGAAAAILGGWQVNQLWSFYSGVPFSVTASGTSLDMPGATQRADLVKPKVEIYGNVGRGMWYFDPTAFASVTEPRFGTAGYMLLRGPGMVNWDFGVHRRFNLTERMGLEFRMEAFNFSNTPHFSNPGGNVSAIDFTGGQLRTNGFTEVTGVTNLARDGIDERQFRFGLKLRF
jgi:hypothetical protein